MTAIAYPNYQVGTEGSALIDQFASAAMRRFGVYNRFIGEATSLEDLVIQLCTARSIMLGIKMDTIERPGMPFPTERVMTGLDQLIEQYLHMIEGRGNNVGRNSARNSQGLQ